MALISNKKEKLKKPDNLGFGNRITGRQYRLLDRNGRYNVKTIGGKSLSLYQELVEMNWPSFFLLVVTFFVVVNALFAVVLLMTGMECLSGVEEAGPFGNLAQAWFFSVQTLTTVGYGSVSPICFSSNVVSSVIALTGLLTFALVTGLFFARFSKPVAQFVYSENAIIAPYKKDSSGFMFRIANRRDNQVINVESKVIMSWVELDKEGHRKRQFTTLPLEYDKVVMLPLSWTIVHPIDEKSPFHGKGKKDLADMEVEVIALVEGYDETFSQKVYINISYKTEEILCGYKFNLMYYPGEEGKTILDLTKINEVEAVPALQEKLNS